MFTDQKLAILNQTLWFKNVGEIRTQTEIAEIDCLDKYLKRILLTI